MFGFEYSLFNGVIVVRMLFPGLCGCIEQNTSAIVPINDFILVDGLKSESLRVNHGGEKSVSTIELNSLFRRSHIQNKGSFL